MVEIIVDTLVVGLELVDWYILSIGQFGAICKCLSIGRLSFSTNCVELIFLLTCPDVRELYINIFAQFIHFTQTDHLLVDVFDIDFECLLSNTILLRANTQINSTGQCKNTSCADKQRIERRYLPIPIGFSCRSETLSKSRKQFHTDSRLAEFSIIEWQIINNNIVYLLIIKLNWKQFRIPSLSKTLIDLLTGGSSLGIESVVDGVDLNVIESANIQKKALAIEFLCDVQFLFLRHVVHTNDDFEVISICEGYYVGKFIQILGRKHGGCELISKSFPFTDTRVQVVQFFRHFGLLHYLAVDFFVDQPTSTEKDCPEHHSLYQFFPLSRNNPMSFLAQILHETSLLFFCFKSVTHQCVLDLAVSCGHVNNQSRLRSILNKSSRIPVAVHTGIAQTRSAHILLDGWSFPASESLEISKTRGVVVVRIPQRNISCSLGTSCVATEDCSPHVMRGINSHFFPLSLQGRDSLHQEITVAVGIMSTPRASWAGVGFHINPDGFIVGCRDSGNQLISLSSGIFASAGEHVDISLQSCRLNVGKTLNSILVHSSERAVSSRNHVADSSVLHTLEISDREQLGDVDTVRAVAEVQHSQQKDETKDLAHNIQVINITPTCNQGIKKERDLVD